MSTHSEETRETKSLYNKDAPQPPYIKRMRTLERREKFYQFVFVLFVVAIGAASTATILKPDIPIIIDYDTGVVRGYYRTHPHRSIEEMQAGVYRFLDYLLSYNSTTVERDQFEAMLMMSPQARKKREQYLLETNFVTKTKAAGIRAHNEYNEAKVLDAKGDMIRFEITGRIVFDNVADEQVKGRAKDKPVHIIVDARMTEITAKNRLGLIVEDYYEYE